MQGTWGWREEGKGNKEDKRIGRITEAGKIAFTD